MGNSSSRSFSGRIYGVIYVYSLVKYKNYYSSECNNKHTYNIMIRYYIKRKPHWKMIIVHVVSFLQAINSRGDSCDSTALEYDRIAIHSTIHNIIIKLVGELFYFCWKEWKSSSSGVNGFNIRTSCQFFFSLINNHTSLTYWPEVIGEVCCVCSMKELICFNIYNRIRK